MEGCVGLSTVEPFNPSAAFLGGCDIDFTCRELIERSTFCGWNGSRLYIPPETPRRPHPARPFCMGGRAPPHPLLCPWQECPSDSSPHIRSFPARTDKEGDRW